MKNLILLTLTLGLLNCSSQKLQTTNIPFTIKQSSFKQILGGLKETGISSILTIKAVKDNDDVQFKKIYFRGYNLSCEVTTTKEEDIILAKFSSKEKFDKATTSAGLNMQQKYELDKNEAILAYTDDANGQLKYVKIEKIKEKPPVAMRSIPKN